MAVQKKKTVTFSSSSNNNNNNNNGNEFNIHTDIKLTAKVLAIKEISQVKYIVELTNLTVDFWPFGSVMVCGPIPWQHS